MSSSVFFKFKSQKEPTRVDFDGTGISVFELKREIINKSGLGDGTDFDLFIYTDDNSDEYDDDTTIISRSTTVIARRQPAARPGAGRAARYVSGKMPISAKNAGRKEQTTKTASSSKTGSDALSQMNNAMTEEEKMAAMFAAQTEQWSAQQEEMSHQAPVFSKAGVKKPANVPDHEPPNGYICYRCGQKGHWIQLCPTNEDPDFDNRPRVKRTTGIPRSFLQKVDKSVIMAQSEGDETKRPSGIMVNADGDFVIAEPDKASWEQFQAKTKSTTTGEAPQEESKDIHARGLECPIDRKMFIEPMKTPCCQKTFCNDCITNALIESDFVCPACHTEGVLIDDLQADGEASKKIQDYVKEKETVKFSPAASPKLQEERGDRELAEAQAEADQKRNSATSANAASEDVPKKSSSPAAQTPRAEPASTTTGEDRRPSTGGVKETTGPTEAAGSKKRPAGEELEKVPKIPKGPKAMQSKPISNEPPNMMNNMNPMMFNNMGMMPNMMGMPTPNMNMNMGMNMGMGMGMPMMNMPMMNMPGNMNGGFGMPGWDMGNMNGANGMNGMGGSMNGMNGMGGMYGMNGNMNGLQGGRGMNGNMNRNYMGHGGTNGFQQQNGYQNGGNFNNHQQQQHFGGGGGGGENEEDSAYFRKPVNPHRHQNKQRRVRPSDYREL